MSRSQDSVSNRARPSPCSKCSRDHLGECLDGQRGYFGYGKLGHKFRDCPYARQRSRDVRPQSKTISAPAPVVLLLLFSVPCLVL